MNPNIINLLITLLVLWMLFGLFNSILAFALSKHGIGVFLLIFVMYQFYKRSGRANRGGGSYYDHINTYSERGFEYSSGRPVSRPGFFASIKAWFGEKYRSYYYRRFNKTWERVKQRYENDMHCPVCSSELTVFNITSDARCSFCKNKLL